MLFSRIFTLVKEHCTRKSENTSLVEDNFAVRALNPFGYDPKSLKHGGQNYIMAKLDETIKAMKEIFHSSIFILERCKQLNGTLRLEKMTKHFRHG